MKRAFLTLIALLGLVIAMLVVATLPLPVEPYLDFQVIYHADMGLLRGIGLYDHAGQVGMIAELAGVQPEQVILHPFPYPPWYALAALPMTFLPIEVAARFWLELNLALLLVSIFLLTDGWKPWMRLASFPLGLLFLPVLGALLIGQFVFPVLLGLSLLGYALQQNNPHLTALAAALLTFKPHLGVWILLALAVYLWLLRNQFGKRSLQMILVAGAVLFGIGFLADPAWPLRYVQSLTGYGQIAGVQSCDICANLPVMLSEAMGAGGIGPALWITTIGLAGFLGWMAWKRSRWHSSAAMITSITLLTLLASPYLLNYDFVLLLVPLFILARQAQDWRDWAIIGIAFALPWLGLGILGRQGNLALILSALLVAGWSFYRRNKLDLTFQVLYNHRNSLREE